MSTDPDTCRASLPPPSPHTLSQRGGGNVGVQPGTRCSAWEKMILACYMKYGCDICIPVQTVQ